MKVIVFGGSGFLGSHVAEALTDAGYDVIIYDLHKSPFLKENQKMIVGNVLDADKVKNAVKGQDYVYNFAGIANIDEAIENPLKTIEHNVLGNAIILEAARQAKIKRFIFASSLYVYSKAGSFYRSTKQACELFIENYQEEFNLPYTILRYGSLYGPRSGDNNFIHRILKQAVHEGAISREGDGEEIREYIHVHDAAAGSVEILSEEFVNQNVIITGNQQIKVKDLLKMINEMMNNKLKINYMTEVENAHYEITPYNFSPKLAKRINLKTYYDLGQGLLRSVEEIYKEAGKTKK